MDIVKSLLDAFGGSVNLTAVLALLGGFSGIAMIVLSPLMALLIKVNWSTSQKNIAVWVVSFFVTALPMYFAHAFTGSLWDVGTWLTAWTAISAGATLIHDKIWGTGGTGISTWIENNFFPGTDVVIPTSASALLPAAEQIAQEMFEAWLKTKGEALVTPAVYTGAGTAGAVPNPGTAPLTGGPTAAPNAVDPNGMAAQANLAMEDAHGSNGTPYVPEIAALGGTQ